VLVSSDLNVLQSLDSLIVEFSQPVSTNRKHFVHHWFGFLPSIYGQNQTLDATIKAFVAHHFGKILQDKQMVGYARSAYGEALHRLRKALTSPSECFSTYVFCAVVLMVGYFCDQICKSVEYSGVGVLGPFRLGFPLLVAHEVSDSLTRSWIVTRLERFSKFYAAAQPKNFAAIA